MSPTPGIPQSDAAAAGATASCLSHAAALLSALADPARLTLLVTLLELQTKDDDHSFTAIAAVLGVTPKAAMKDLVRLSDSGLVDFDSHSATVDLAALTRAADALIDRMPATRLLADKPELARFFRHGRLVAVPENARMLRQLAEMIVELLPADRSLGESEVNELLHQVHHDHASLRRLLVDFGLATRNAGREYRRVLNEPASGN